MNASKTKRIIIRNDGWGTAIVENVLAVLTSSIELFEKSIKPENFNSKMVVVQHSSYHSPPIDHPKMYKRDPENLIFLDTKDNFWSQYAYQFAHEYCHHLIESNFINSFDQFGWFEESLCELASIHSIKNMAQIWINNPPYPNWKDYATSLDEYSNEIINRSSNNIKLPLKNWICNNLEELSKNRYIREKNCLVAVNISDLFFNNPQLWDTIPLIGNVEITESMDFEEFINKWSDLIPDSNKKSWNQLKKRLIN